MAKNTQDDWKLVEGELQSKFNVGDVVYSRTWQRDVIIQEILPCGFYKVGDIQGLGWFKEREDNLHKENITLPIDSHLRKVTPFLDMTTDRFKIRLTEHNALIKGIKEDIKAVLLEKGYRDTAGYASFNFTCKPDRFKQVGIDFGQLYFVDNSNDHWHSDNVNDVNELLSILRAMYHIIDK